MPKRSLLPALWGREDRMPLDFDSFRKEMDRFFDSFGQNMHRELAPLSARFELNPEMDVHDSEKSIDLSVELPGVDEKDIDISVSGQTITISGEKKSETESKEKGGYRKERVYGSFERQLTLPFKIDAGKVTAKSEKGVLKVSIPKPAEAIEKPSKVKIASK